MLTPTSFQVLTSTSQVHSSLTHLLLISSGPYYSSAVLSSPWFLIHKRGTVVHRVTVLELSPGAVATLLRSDARPLGSRCKEQLPRSQVSQPQQPVSKPSSSLPPEPRVWAPQIRPAKLLPSACTMPWGHTLHSPTRDSRDQSSNSYSLAHNVVPIKPNHCLWV